ncbi:MAG: solute carrier family 23 protein [Bacillaceae bacterium]
MSANNKVVLNIEDRPAPIQWIFLSIQHLFAMFGATVLVPRLTGLSPAVALVASGLATLTFIIVTRGKAPSYLGSSFAFITPIIAAKEIGGVGPTMIACAVAGLVYGVVALIIRTAGIKWIMKILPPIVIGPVVMVIGLSLSGTAIGMAMNKTLEDGTAVYDAKYFLVAMVTLGITILFSIFGRGMFGIIPVLIGIIGGYLFAMVVGIVDFTPVLEAKWFAMPEFQIPFVHYDPSFSAQIMMLILPVAIVTISEHIGHQVVLGNVVGRDMFKEPGLDRSILGDGLATMVAAFIGAPPNTTYGENIGVLAITRVYSIYVFIGAAFMAITFGFIGKLSALINSIPTPVMGGVCILLFGIIASSGLRMLIDEKIDFGNKRNLVIASVILVIGIGGAKFNIGAFHFEGMALAAIIGVILNLIIPDNTKNSPSKKEENEVA